MCEEEEFCMEFVSYTCFYIVYIENPKKMLLSVLCSANAYSRCVLFNVMRERIHDLCGFVTELHGFCER